MEESRQVNWHSLTLINEDLLKQGRLCLNLTPQEPVENDVNGYVHRNNGELYIFILNHRVIRIFSYMY
jgi:hypothetical protein